ncbi:MAG: hypothetical protein K8H90_01595, partial [Thermoanaerobaculia bacterium]|nr:hypothetical protein [Thermoanaerobaculia bacterium]
MVVLPEDDHPRATLGDLAVTQDEQLGHGHPHLATRGALRRPGKLCHDDVALLDPAHDLQVGRIDELGRAVDGPV